MLRQHLPKAMVLLYILISAWLFFGLCFLGVGKIAGAASFEECLYFAEHIRAARLYKTLAIAGVLFLMSCLVLGPLGLGIKMWFFKATQDPSLPLWEGFCCFTDFKRYLSSLHYFWRMWLIRVGSAVLFLGPCAAVLSLCYRWFIDAQGMFVQLIAAFGIMVGFIALLIAMFALVVFWQRYFLTAAYLNCGYSVKSAFAMSVQSMKNNKWEPIKLWLTYAHWFAGCILIVPALYVVPHFLCAVGILTKILLYHTIDKSQNAGVTQ